MTVLLECIMHVLHKAAKLIKDPFVIIFLNSSMVN